MDAEEAGFLNRMHIDRTSGDQIHWTQPYIPGCCNATQHAENVEDVENMSPMSEHNTCGSNARFLFADIFQQN